MQTQDSQLSFRISAEARTALQGIKARDGIPVSEQIRRAVDLWINERNRIDGITQYWTYTADGRSAGFPGVHLDHAVAVGKRKGLGVREVHPYRQGYEKTFTWVYLPPGWPADWEALHASLMAAAQENLAKAKAKKKDSSDRRHVKDRPSRRAAPSVRAHRT